VYGLASEALRTIAIAYRPISEDEKVGKTKVWEQNLTLIGMQGMIDPPRVEAKDAIKECQEAGIKTIMITGDHKLTAAAIATDLNILPEGGKVLDGQALSMMNDRELEEI